MYTAIVMMSGVMASRSFFFSASARWRKHESQGWLEGDTILWRESLVDCVQRDTRIHRSHTHRRFLAPLLPYQRW